MIKEERYKKTHPFSILKNLKLSVLLILFSILMQLLFNPQGWFEMISALGLNAIYAIVVISYSVTLYRKSRYRLGEDRIFLRGGILFQKDYSIFFDKMQTIAFHYDLMASFFGAVKVSIDTPAGSSRKCDASAYLSKKKAEVFRQLIMKGLPHTSYYRSGPLEILLASLFWSNPASGLLFVIPVFSRLRSLLGKEKTSELVKESLNPGGEILASVVSPAVALVILLILACWVISIVLTYQRYLRFTSYRSGDYLVITRGLVSPATVLTRFNGIICVSEDQSLLMRIFRLHSAGITVIGSGKLKGDKGMMIPPVRKRELDQKLQEVLGILPREEKSLRPVKGSWWSYLYYPLIWVGLMAVYLVLNFVFSLGAIAEMLFPAAVLVFLVLLWWVAFRIFAYHRAHLAVGNRHLILCTYHKLTLKRYHIPFRKIARIEMTQSIFQKVSGKCSVKVYVYYEKNLVYTIKQLNLKQAEELLSQLPLK